MDFYPAVLQIEDVKFNNQFAVRLNTPPKTDVSLSFDALEIRFVECFLIFTPEDWNVWKYVTIQPIPNFKGTLDGAQNVSIKATALSNDTIFDGAVAEYLGTRYYSKGGTCKSIGDPHIHVWLLFSHVVFIY